MSSRRFLLRTLPLWLCAAAPLFSDVTVRYQTTLTPASFLPPQAREQAEKALQSGAANMTMRMKNGKGLTTMGRWTTLADFAKEQVTLIDNEQHQYATMRPGELADHLGASMPQLPEEARKAMSAMKVDFKSKVTGRTETINGVAAEEREVAMTMEMPNNMGAMRMMMQIWSAKSDAGLTNAAIRELMGYNLWAYSFMNPASTMQKMTSHMPGLADSMKQMIDEFAKAKAVILRNTTSTYVPLPPAAIEQLAKMNPGGPPPDPNAPMMKINQEVAELSTAPVDAKLFEIPADYKSVPAADLVKTMFQSQMQAAGGAPKP